MARVIYGVMGNTYGHVARTLAIVSRLPEHEFHFVGGGRAAELVSPQYPVMEVPVKRTIHKNQRVSIMRTCAQLARCVRLMPAVKRRILNLVLSFQPDLAISDREIFLPHGARAAGLECIGLDHSHVLPACRYPVPPGQFISWNLARIEDALFFNRTRRNLIVSFFHPELKPGRSDELLPPVLRPEVREMNPTNGDHILMYQTSPTFRQLLDAVRKLPRHVIAYGFRNAHATEGNITFKPFDSREILVDLATSAYAIVNGGHNLICEALYYGKPVMCFPITGQFEQFLNAWHIRELGYGDFSTSRHPDAAFLQRFEERLDLCRETIREKFTDGTDVVVNRVRELIEQAARRSAK